ncbi:MAG: hypothetical protein V1647_06875 [Pseudomonadota bacterium]
MNKKWLFFGMLFTVSTLLHARSNIEVYDGVVIKLCPPRILGCAPRADVAGRDVLLEPVSQKARAGYKKLVRETKSQGQFQTRPVKITGRILKEKGHFPNPMADFDVLKIMEIQ